MNHLGEFPFVFWLARLVSTTVYGLLILGGLYLMVTRMSAGARDFWVKVFSDQDGPSFARVGTGIVLLFSCGWVTHIVRQTNNLPNFAGLAIFLGTLYGLKQFSAAIVKIWSMLKGNGRGIEPKA